MLYRKFYDEFVKWYHQKRKLALLIDGARQIGKTTLVRQFAKDYYGDHFVEITVIISSRSILSTRLQQKRSLQVICRSMGSSVS